MELESRVTLACRKQLADDVILALSFLRDYQKALPLSQRDDRKEIRQLIERLSNHALELLDD